MGEESLDFIDLLTCSSGPPAHLQHEIGTRRSDLGSATADLAASGGFDLGSAATAYVLGDAGERFAEIRHGGTGGLVLP